MNRLIFHDEKFPRRKLIVLDFSASLGGAENGKKYRKIEIKIKKTTENEFDEQSFCEN